MSLQVDDGTGLADADAYISVDDATAYHAAYGNTAWAAIDPAVQEVYVRKATRDLDLLFGRSYLSTPLTTTQALLWPRSTYTNANGFTVTGIPVQLANATAELALLNLTVDVVGPSDNSGNVKATKVKVDVIEKSTEYFTATASVAPKMRRVNIMMQPLCSPMGFTIPVTR